MSDIACPYCGQEQDITNEDANDYNENVLHEKQCITCEKEFTYSISISYDYEAFKADCLNTGNHKWKQQIGQPKAYFMGKYSCETCEAEKIDEQEHAKGLAILEAEFNSK